MYKTYAKYQNLFSISKTTFLRIGVRIVPKILKIIFLVGKSVWNLKIIL